MALIKPVRGCHTTDDNAPPQERGEAERPIEEAESYTISSVGGHAGVVRAAEGQD